MEQKPINQRIKFLIKESGISARAFSELINESPTNTHNYTSKRNAEPRAGYLQNIVSHFPNINAQWLITGQGEPFLSPSTHPNNSHLLSTKNFQGNVAKNVSGTQNQNSGMQAEGLSDLAMAKALIEQLKSQLADKERIIQLLEKNSQ